jgi:asparagine synthase (glutamine-hydrolysing)
MRTGFEVILRAAVKAEFQVFSPQPAESPELSLVTFAQDSITGRAAVLMGRLYYQDELKARLPKEIDRDLPSDAALALAIFRHYGSQGLEWLEGEFALVIFDPERQCLFAMRDPMGSWSLYWASDGKTVWVSTNLRLLAGRLPQASINRDFLASFLMFPYAFVELATEKTAFEGIKRILPGTILALHPDGRAQPTWFWDWIGHIPQVENIAPEEAGFQFAQLFRQAIEERIKFGKIASHLSGGMDSSSVVCIARELFAAGTVPGKLTTFSLVYQMPSLAGERDYIQMIVDRGGPLDPHYLDGDAALDFQWFTEKIPDHDEPYAGLFHLAMEKVLVDLAARLGVTTILSGGGAELIVEGNRFHLADFVRQGRWFAVLEEASQWAQAKNLSLWSVLRQFAIDPLIPPLLRQGIAPLVRRGYGCWPKLGSFSIPPWILPEFARNQRMWNKALATLRQLNLYPVEQSFNLLGLKGAAGNWASWYLGAQLGIRICHPFLDPRLIAYCLGLPRELREIPGMSKPLLHFAMDGILPEPILTRRFKASFNDVYWTGLSRNLLHLEEMVERSQIDELGIFDKRQLIQAMRQHANGIGDVRSGNSINISLALIAWFDQTEKALHELAEQPNAIYASDSVPKA